MINHHHHHHHWTITISYHILFLLSLNWILCFCHKQSHKKYITKPWIVEHELSSSRNLNSINHLNLHSKISNRILIWIIKFYESGALFESSGERNADVAWKARIVRSVPYQVQNEAVLWETCPFPENIHFKRKIWWIMNSESQSDSAFMVQTMSKSNTSSRTRMMCCFQFPNKTKINYIYIIYIIII